MSQDIAAQLTALWQGVLLGAAMGLLYDFFRVLRARIKLPFLGPALDILFWCAVTAALFVWSQWIWGGVVRLYGAVLCFGGGAVYFWLFSPWFLRLGWLCADLTAIFWRILTMPWKAGVLLLQKCKEFLISLFLFRRKWYKIKRITQEMEQVDRRRKQREGRGREHEAETSQFFN